MLVQQTIDNLKKLYLSGMVEAYQNPTSDSLSLSFDERFGLIVDFEWTTRNNRKLARLLKEARLRLPACLEDIDYHHSRGLDRSLMVEFKSLRWLSAYQNIFISGPTGVGKTYVACALGNLVCRHGFKVRYIRVSSLLNDLNLAKADGSYHRVRQGLARMNLLILDDWGVSPFTQLESRELLEIIEDRFQTGSTIITSQVPVDSWHGLFADPTVADAILDRLVHNAHHVAMYGESMRKLIHAVSKGES